MISGHFLKGKTMQKLSVCLLSALLWMACHKKPASQNGQADKEWAAVTHNWQPFTSQSEKFTALFPVAPKPSQQSQNTAAGEATLFNYKAQTSDGLYYVVSFVKFKPGTFKDAVPSERLKSAVEGMLANVNGKLIQEETLMLRKEKGEGFYPGKGVVAAAPEGDLMIRAHLYMVEDSLIQIVFVGKDSAEHAQSFKAFSSSFKLI